MNYKTVENMTDVDPHSEQVAQELTPRRKKRKLNLDEIDREGRELTEEELAQALEENLDSDFSDDDSEQSLVEPDEDEWEITKKQKISHDKAPTQLLLPFRKHNLPSSASSHSPGSSTISAPDNNPNYFHLAALEEGHTTIPDNRQFFRVHENLPVEFFEFCASLGKFDVVPGAVLPAEYLADTYVAFYVDCGIYVHIFAHSHVCAKSEEELQDEEWVLENIRKGIPLSIPVVAEPRRQKKPSAPSRIMVQLRKYGLQRPTRQNPRGRNLNVSALGKEQEARESKALEDSMSNMTISRLRPASSCNARGQNLNVIALEKENMALADTMRNLKISPQDGEKKGRRQRQI